MSITFRMRYLFVFTLLFSSLLVVTANAGVEVGVSLDKNSFTSGQSAPLLSVSATNGQQPLTADVHIGYFSSPNNTVGAIYEYPDWNTILRPCLAAFTFPQNFNLPSTPLVTLPQNLDPGTWTAFVALTEPGTINILSIAVAPFTVLPVNTGGASFGSVYLSYSQTPSGSDISAGGVFARSNGSLDDLIEFIEGQEPGLDQCIFNEVTFGDMTTPPGVQITTLDAGSSLQLLSSTGPTASLPKEQNFGFITYSADEAQLGSNFFSGGATYTFKGTGGLDVGPFTVGLVAPAPLNLTQPPLIAQAEHDTSTDLQLRWGGNAGNGEVLASLSGATLTKSYSIDCRFVDDGIAAIPSSLLQQLKNKLGDGLSVIDDLDDLPGIIDLPGFGATANLSVSRFRSTTFNTTNTGLNYGLAIIDAGVGMSLTLQ